MSEVPAPEDQMLRILVAENHRDTLIYLQMYLESLGHAVTPAGTVKEARTALDQGGYDVLISDIGLPDGTGWDLLREVHAHGTRDLYAVAMTGFGLGADRLRSQEAGYRHHLLKPFDLTELDAMLEEAARERHPHDKPAR